MRVRFLPEIFLAHPGDLATPTGGYEYDRRVMAGLTALGWKVHAIPFPGHWPNPSDNDLAGAGRLLAALPDRMNVLADGLLYGALPLDMLRAVQCRFAALVHHPLADETGITAPEAEQLRENERAALNHAAQVIATSRFTADLLYRDYGVMKLRLTVARPGQDRVPPAKLSDGPPVLLSVGALVPRKAYRDLIAALAALKDQQWTCRIAGALDRNAGEAWAVREAIASHGLDGRVILLGAVDDAQLQAEYCAATLYVSASSFEGYGMAAATALAHGLPVVAAKGGALPDLFPPGTAMLVPPGDVEIFTDALSAMLTNNALRARHAKAARAAGEKLPTWNDTAQIIADVLNRMA